jgi:hypothetical protein
MQGIAVCPELSGFVGILPVTTRLPLPCSAPGPGYPNLDLQSSDLGAKDEDSS